MRTAAGGGEEDCGPTLEEVKKNPERYMYSIDDVYASPLELYQRTHSYRMLRRQYGVDLTTRRA